MGLREPDDGAGAEDRADDVIVDQGLRTYLVVTGAYWAFTLTDGAIHMLVVLHFHNLGFSPPGDRLPVPLLRGLRHHHQRYGRLDRLSHRS